MRVPYTINKNTLNVYKTNEKIQYVSKIRSDRFDWDEHIPKCLQELCIHVLVDNWENKQIYDEILLPSDKNLLLQLLPTTLPLELVVAKVEDDIYWERRFNAEWPNALPPERIVESEEMDEHEEPFEKIELSSRRNTIGGLVVKNGVSVAAAAGGGFGGENTSINSQTIAVNNNGASLKSSESVYTSSPRSDFSIEPFYYPKTVKKSWKQCFLEKYLQEQLERMKPEEYDAEKIKVLAQICGPFVKILDIRELQANVNQDCVVHIHLEPILTGLTNLSELSICFQQKNVGEFFQWHILKTSLRDIACLGNFLAKCRLKTFRIIKSDVDCTKCIALLKGIIRNTTIKEIDFSHCKISDRGVFGICRVIQSHPALNSVNLSNNRIGLKGAQGLAYVLSQSSCKLKYLDLRLNFIGSAGGQCIMKSLINGAPKLTTLILTGCRIDSSNEIIGKMLTYNKTLRYLNLSNNKLGETIGQEILDGLEENVTLTKLDLRVCGISPELDLEIRQSLQNRETKLKEIGKVASRTVRFLDEEEMGQDDVSTYMKDFNTVENLFVSNFELKQRFIEIVKKTITSQAFVIK